MGAPRKQDDVCAVEGCVKLTAAWNRCSNHYDLWRRSLTSWPIKHGTVNSYTNLKCRCRQCSRANTENHGLYHKSLGIGPISAHTVGVPPEFWVRFKGFAEQQGQSMRSLAMEAIERMMSEA